MREGGRGAGEDARGGCEEGGGRGMRREGVVGRGRGKKGEV